MKPYYDDGQIQIWHADCRDVLPSIDWTSAIVVSDPPYGTGGWRRPESGQGDNPAASLVIEDWDEGAVDWLGLVKAEAVLAFWPPARTRELLNAAAEYGFPKHRAMYLHKPDPKPQPGGRIMWSVEPIWVMSKDGFLLKGGTDWHTASTPRIHKYHPYQKPITAMRWIIAKTEAEVIVDPFMGSGTTLRAAKDLGRRAIGIERSEADCESAVERLSQQVLDLTA